MPKYLFTPEERKALGAAIYRDALKGRPEEATPSLAKSVWHAVKKLEAELPELAPTED